MRADGYSLDEREHKYTDKNGKQYGKSPSSGIMVYIQ
jgi:hypothetical protein